MNDTCLTPAACAPHATTLNATLRTYCDAAIKPDQRLAGKSRPIMCKPCAPLEAWPDRRAQVIRSLGALGMDKASASTFVAMTEQLFASDSTTQDA